MSSKIGMVSTCIFSCLISAIAKLNKNAINLKQNIRLRQFAMGAYILK